MALSTEREADTKKATIEKLLTIIAIFQVAFSPSRFLALRWGSEARDMREERRK